MPYSAQNTILFVSSSTQVSTSTAAGSSAHIGYVTGFSGPDGQSAEIDITSFQSTAKEFLLGVSDEGNMSVDFLAQTSGVGQKNLIEAKQTRSMRRVVMTLPDPTTSQIMFTGYVKSFSLSGAVDDKVSGNAVIRISGAVTWTTAP